ncbi:hypothetical protein N6L27_16835 [Leisingera sp. SS27]|uniref:hypothetical protein n=1 Tax=Leisingera sp. SS27 TaxID=2979462 RepID=UPI00232B3258|nr:hypothetical protein [Leisingera sp. SS27]MDC0659670.1 hypothetical protein [Leisingera sp. SS27]
MDSNHLDAELAKMRIDHGTWWNIWRLTPEVYRHVQSDAWTVKNDLKVFEAEGIEARAHYAFDNTVDIIRKKQNFQKSLRWINGSSNYIVKPKRGVKIFRKADRNSEVVKIFPDGLSSIRTEYSTPGLNGEGTYWHVSHFHQNEGESEYTVGFIDENDINWS